MPAWITITPDQLPISTAEYEQLQKFKPENFEKFVAECLADTISQVRSRVGAKPGFRLDADRTLIPPELKRQALWLAFEAIKTDATIAIPLTDDQRTAISNARKDLAAVVSGEFSVSVPANPEPAPSEQAGSAVEMLTPTPQRWTRTLQAGL